MTDIIKQEAQILNAEEYNLMRDALNYRHRLVFDGLLFTGMRGTEFWIFIEHPEWFHPERQYINLTKEAIKKERTRFKERNVLLSHVGTRAIRDLVDAIKRGEVEHISRMGWGEDLKRAARKAGLKTQAGITPKMTRKTWVSWLMAVFSYDGLRISSSLGHDVRTMQEHYLSLPFSTYEIEQIKPLVTGWGNNRA
jgi:integrase